MVEGVVHVLDYLFSSREEEGDEEEEDGEPSDQQDLSCVF